MRLLVINPNTSPGVTARIATAADAVKHPDDLITTTCAAFGPKLIVTPEDAAEAEKGVLAALAAHKDPIDGIILASFGDTGAEAVRAALPGVPVVGLAGAAFATARALGGTVGVVTFGEDMVAGLRDVARKQGVSDCLLGISALPLADAGDPGTVQERHGAALSGLAHDMAAQGPTSIILGGGPLAGLAGRIRPEVPVPVIDGVQAAVGLLRGVVSVGGAARTVLP